MSAAADVPGIGLDWTGRLLRGVGLLRPPLALAEVAMPAVRWLVAGCQAATILITWPLWQVHASPPMLPALPLPAVDLGVVLLVSLALVPVAPGRAIAVHTALLVYAVLIDQTRLQPEVVSLTFLMWGTLPNHTARTFARAHLVTLWFFAGLNKLFSPDFLHDRAPWMLTGLVDNPSPWLVDHFGYLVALAELGTGVLALLPWTRRLAAWAILALHAGILLDLSPLGHDWNEAVWPWNVALAVGGFAFIAPWQGSPLRCLKECHAWLRPALVLLVVAPLGFYVGVTDAYLAHNLYSANTPRAAVTCPRGCLPDQQPGSTWTAFQVPLPPEHRLFEEYFARTCRPGDVMQIEDSRWWFAWRGRDHRRLECPTKS
jgi:hypothetical protein